MQIPNSAIIGYICIPNTSGKTHKKRGQFFISKILVTPFQIDNFVVVNH